MIQEFPHVSASDVKQAMERLEVIEVTMDLFLVDLCRASRHLPCFFSMQSLIPTLINRQTQACPIQCPMRPSFTLVQTPLNTLL